MKVRIGVGLGVRTKLHGPEFGEFVDTVERLRFDSLWLSERISGEAPDPVVAMSYAAGRTTTAEVRHERARAAGPQPDRAGQGDGDAGDHVGRPPAAGVRPRRRRRHGAPGVRRRAQGAGQVVRRGAHRDAQVLVRRRRRPRRRRASTTRASRCARSRSASTSGSAASPRRSSSAVGRLADGWLPSFVTPADAAAGRAVIEQVAAEHEREIEDDHYGVLIPYTMEQPSPTSCWRSWPSVAPTSRTRRRSCRSAGTPSSTPSSASSTSAPRSSSSSRSSSRRDLDDHLAAAAEALLPLET